MVSYPVIERTLKDLVSKVIAAMRGCKSSGSDRIRLAQQQVDVIIFGLLVTRALRGANIWGIRIGTNLVATDCGFDLRFSPTEMKGHRKFETSCPDELAAIIKYYLRHGYRALTGRTAGEGDVLLVNRRGKPFDRSSFISKVPRMSRRLIGKPINAHLFRHIVATHAAQEWKLTPTELAAFLAHRSPLTCMKYYEVTNPALAAVRVDEFRRNQSASPNRNGHKEPVYFILDDTQTVKRAKKMDAVGKLYNHREKRCVTGHTILKACLYHRGMTIPWGSWLYVKK
jgi:Phage integrase family